jgi:hypothetical protein
MQCTLSNIFPKRSVSWSDVCSWHHLPPDHGGPRKQQQGLHSTFYLSVLEQNSRQFLFHHIAINRTQNANTLSPGGGLMEKWDIFLSTSPS